MRWPDYHSTEHETHNVATAHGHTHGNVSLDPSLSRYTAATTIALPVNFILQEEMLVKVEVARHAEVSECQDTMTNLVALDPTRFSCCVFMIRKVPAGTQLQPHFLQHNRQHTCKHIGTAYSTYISPLYASTMHQVLSPCEGGRLADCIHASARLRRRRHPSCYRPRNGRRES